MPNARILNTNPHLRVRPGLATVTTTTISPALTFGGPGYLIGMLGMTYIASHTIAAVTVTTVASGDYKPHIRIKSN